MWSLQLGAGSVTPRRPFRAWLLSVIFPNGKQVVVMWNRKDCVSHVKKYLEPKTGLPCELQILRKTGVATLLVDEHLLFNRNVRDEDFPRPERVAYILFPNLCEGEEWQEHRLVG